MIQSRKPSREFSQEFHDMRLRLLNGRSRARRHDGSFVGIVTRHEKPPHSYSNGVFYTYTKSGQAFAQIGDLTIPVDAEELQILLSLAQEGDSPFAWQW